MPNRKFHTLGDKTAELVARRRAEAVLLHEEGLSVKKIAKQLRYASPASVWYLIKTHEGEMLSNEQYRIIFESVQKGIVHMPSTPIVFDDNGSYIKHAKAQVKIRVTDVRNAASMPSIVSWDMLAAMFQMNKKTMEKFCRIHEITPHFLKETNDKQHH